MHSRRLHPLIALTLALCLVLAQLAVAVHGVVHPSEHPGTQHSPVCKHLSAHALGSALPVSNTFYFGSEGHAVAVLAPRLPDFLVTTRLYQPRAPPDLA
ncbi:hypothetical protein ACFDAU_00045 [Sulfuriferula sp. GW1]|uniref:hypothetical protein n=1 Tax=Sulfuriferula sp. GW1 TaxID=3345111 RepID=UPI0039AFBA13